MHVAVLVLLLEQQFSLLELVKLNKKYNLYLSIYLSEGPIGLVSMLAAKAMGAETIIMTGKIPVFNFYSFNCSS
jgi:hypothetical protein